MRREVINLTLVIDVPEGEPLPSETPHFSAFVGAGVSFFSRLKVVEHRVEKVTRYEPAISGFKRCPYHLNYQYAEANSQCPLCAAGRPHDR